MVTVAAGRCGPVALTSGYGRRDAGEMLQCRAGDERASP